MSTELITTATAREAITEAEAAMHDAVALIAPGNNVRHTLQKALRRAIPDLADFIEQNKGDKA